MNVQTVDSPSRHKEEDGYKLSVLGFPQTPQAVDEAVQELNGWIGKIRWGDMLP